MKRARPNQQCITEPSNNQPNGLKDKQLVDGDYDTGRMGS
jgi:hypothetical protein